MQNVEAISGFSDLKKQFALTCNFVKPLNELSLWFSELGGDIYVHDYEDHNVCMVIAINMGEAWGLRLKINSPSYNLMLGLIKFNKKPESPKQIANELNSLFRLYGTIPLRLLK